MKELKTLKAKEEWKRTPLKQLSEATAETYRSQREQVGYLIERLVNKKTTGDLVLDFVMKSGMKKDGKPADFPALYRRIEGVCNLRKRLEKNRGRDVLSEYNNGTYSTFRWGVVAKDGDVLLLEPHTVSLGLEVYEGMVLNINTDGFHKGYDPLMYEHMYTFNMNLPLLLKYGHMVGEKAEEAVVKLEKKYAGQQAGSKP
jgi:hypothetical protein